MSKILIVEDDEKISMALTIRLRSAGYEVLAAHDALMAVSTARKAQPDLVLLDIMMPGGNGFTVAENLQNLSETAKTPIIFLTASKKPGLKERAEEIGAAGFIEKPYDGDSLVSQVESVLNQLSSPEFNGFCDF